jgi:hypothetical protein
MLERTNKQKTNTKQNKRKFEIVKMHLTHSPTFINSSTFILEHVLAVRLPLLCLTPLRTLVHAVHLQQELAMAILIELDGGQPVVNRFYNVRKAVSKSTKKIKT